MMLSHGLAAGSKTFSLVFAANATSVDLRTAALAAGWNGTSPVVATVNPGVTISGKPALTVSGAWPDGVELIVSASAVIAGLKASGPYYNYTVGPGVNGNQGSTGLVVSVPLKVTNNGVIAGGGGSGGSGAAAYAPNNAVLRGGYGADGATYPGAGTNGGTGESSYGGTYGGDGGRSGSAGGAGDPGQSCRSWGTSELITYPGGAGGAGGRSVQGNSFITWLVTGTRIGSIS